MTHDWMYRTTGLFGTEHMVGPCAESELLELAASGRLGLNTLVSSQTRTQGNWYLLAHVLALAEAFREGERQRQDQKEAARQFDEMIRSIALPPPLPDIVATDSKSEARGLLGNSPSGLIERPSRETDRTASFVLCPSCGGNVADNVPICPHCGFLAKDLWAGNRSTAVPLHPMVAMSRICWVVIAGLFLYSWLYCAGATILAPHKGHQAEYEEEIGRVLVRQSRYVSPQEEMAFSWKIFAAGTVLLGLPVLILFLCLFMATGAREKPRRVRQRGNAG